MDVPAPGRLRAAVLYAALVLGLALALTAGALVLGGSPAPRDAARTAAPAADAPLDRLAEGDLAGGIAALQTHLRAQPDDAPGWAALGAAYVEQARTSGDPTRYPQAQAAFTRSLRISPATTTPHSPGGPRSPPPATTSAPPSPRRTGR